MASTSSSQGSSNADLFRNARFTAGGSQDEIQAPTSTQLLGDAAALHPLAGLNSGELDYLLLDDGKLNDLEGGQTVLPSRGWSDELCYGTGTTYLAGLSAGGLWGLREGLARSRRFPTSSNSTINTIAKQASTAAEASTSASLGGAASAAQSPSAPAAFPTSTKTSPRSESAAGPVRTPGFRIRLNAVLNSVTRRGTFVGNNAGVLALIYNAFNSSIDKYRGRHDIYGSMLAGASTGLLWKSTAGIRPMFIASAGMTAGAAAWTRIKPSLV